MKLTSAALLCMAAALLWTTIAGEAATPSSGTLSVATPTLSYTGGPFVISNPSAQATGEPQCGTPATPCDDYTLTVNVPAGYENTHNVRIEIEWPNTVEDYDVYLRQGAATIKDSASSSDPEVIIIDANSGTYVIRTVPFAVAGGSITGTVKLIEKPASPPPPPPGVGTPRYKNYVPPTESGLGTGAGEPTMGVGLAGTGHSDGRSMFIAGLETLRVTYDDCSSPAKTTWEDKSSPTTSVVTLDPILWTDPQTGRTFVSQLSAKTSLMAFTDDDGETWTPSQGSGINSGVDHQNVGGGPFVPGLPDGTGTYPNAFYYASQDIAVAQIGLSRDGGLTFGPAVPMWNLTQCGGLHGHIKVAPDGTVYVPNKGCGGAQGVAVSTDEGLSFTVSTVPGSTPGDTDPSLDIDKGGRVYFGYADGDGHPRVAVSTNQGGTWSTPIDVGTSFGLKNTVFPAVVAGDAGRAAFTFLSTPTGGNYQDMANFTGEWHIYSASTFDGGATWTTVDVTPDDPVQIGSICTSGTTCGEDRNLLDFNDATVDQQGRVMIAYADGCIKGQCDEPSESRSALATIARQSGGKRLFAAFDPVEPKVPEAPLVNTVAEDGSGAVRVDWEEPDNGGSAITGYKVYRRTAAGTYGAPLATVSANKTDYNDATADPTVQYFYKVTATNAIGEGANCGEFPVGEVVEGSACILPGLRIMTDGTGDSLDTLPSHDVQSLSVGEPFGIGSGKVVFTLKVADLSTVPADTHWPVEFDAPNGTRYVAQMSTVAPATPLAPAFEYGDATALTLIPADPLSGYQADGTIKIVVPLSGLGNPAVGQELSGFLTRIAVFVGAVTLTPDNMPNSLAPTGSYDIVGNDFCRPNNAPTAILTANRTSGPAPLTVMFDGSGSFDPDTGTPPDTIASYTFDFGDGSAPVTQSSPTISHTYTEVGAFRATLKVIDSRGEQGANIAGVNIEVRALTMSSIHWGLGSYGHIPTQEDYDADGQTDFAVWQPSNGTWYVYRSTDGVSQEQFWGTDGDKPVQGDYDNDGKADFAVFRPSDATWYVLRSSDGSTQTMQWGLSTDKPVPGDYDGDGKTDFAVFRPSDGTWYIFQSSTGTYRSQPWGLSDDKPVQADFDGDGKTDVAVFRPSDSTWYILESTTGGYRSQQWGQSTDVPVPADYDEDGRADVAVFRPSDTVWYVLKSTDGSLLSQQWGQSTDIAVPGNYDGSNAFDIAVWRPSDGNWYIISGF